MKAIGAILLLSLSFSALSQDYTVVRFEADDYRTFSIEELSGHLGSNSDLLPHLKCNGRDEHNPFQKPLRMNPLRNSLKVRVPKTDTTFTYQLGRFFDAENNEVTSFSDPFVQSVARALSRFENIEVTRILLRELEESYFPLTIARGGNSYNPQIPGGRFWSGIKMAQAVPFLITKRMSEPSLTHPFSDIGVGGEIRWSPTLKIESIESDGVKRELDKDVALAHEMYHAFDSIRGLLDMGFVSGENYESQPVLEYRAVYFENLVREELGIKFRKHYGDPWVPEGQDPSLAPDLLDDSGRPIYIASPCLR